MINEFRPGDKVRLKKAYPGLANLIGPTRKGALLTVELVMQEEDITWVWVVESDDVFKAKDLKRA